MFQIPAAAVLPGHNKSEGNWFGTGHGRQRGREGGETVTGGVFAFALFTTAKLGYEALQVWSLPGHADDTHTPGALLTWQKVPVCAGHGANMLMPSPR